MALEKMNTSSASSQHHPNILSRCTLVLAGFFRPFLMIILKNIYIVWGDKNRISIGAHSRIANATLNTSSGKIIIGDHVFFGHNVSVITGTHDYTLRRQRRMQSWPDKGNDIHIDNGVWVGTGAIILGPCTIGADAVIGAGSLVSPKTIIEPGTVYMGFPAKYVKHIKFSDSI